MANVNPPKKGQAFSFTINVNQLGIEGQFKVNPTITAGDWMISKDGGAYANLANLPTLTPAGSDTILISLTETAGTNSEMNADRVHIRGKSSTTPREYADFGICILTTV